MVRLIAAVLVLASLAGSGYAQAPAQPVPAGSQPALAQTPQDVVKLADQYVARITELNKAGNMAEAGRLAAEAQRELERVLQADANNVDAQLVLGDLLLQTRDFDKAHKLFKDVLQHEPGNFRANLALGRYYLDSHYWRQATKYLSDAAKVAPPGKQAETLRLLSISLGGEKDRVRAVSTAEQAVSADPADVVSISNLIDMYVEAQQFEKAVARADALVEAARQAHEARLADRAALEQLISAYQTKTKCLSGYYSLLCKRDARGRATEQIESGKEADAVRVLSEVAAAQEETAKLAWELSYHQTLQIIEPVAGCQSEEGRARLESNTGHLLNLAGLYWATHQTDRAVELFQRIIGLQKPSDTNPAEVRRNQDTAREFLTQHGLPLAAPAEAPARP